jgi:phage terminase large subunit
MSSAQFPDKLDFLFDQHRYKVAYGGRGSGKSWGYARALLISASKKNEPFRILCAREIQRSIRQSVHQLLSDQIQTLGLGSLYEVLETEIRGRNGTNLASPV